MGNSSTASVSASGVRTGAGAGAASRSAAGSIAGSGGAYRSAGSTGNSGAYRGSGNTGNSGAYRGSGSTGNGNVYRSSGSAGSGGVYRSSGTSYQSHRKRGRKPSPNYWIIAIVGVILILVIAAAAFAVTKNPDRLLMGKEETTVPSTEETETETELVKEVTVDNIKITGMSRDQAKEAILAGYPWKMTASYEGEVYELANLMSGKVDALLEEIFTGIPREKYTLDTTGLDDAVAAEVASMRGRWNKAPRNGSISSYDAASDSFVFVLGEYGVEIDEEKLTGDIMEAIRAKDFDAEIQVSANTVEPEITKARAEALYKTIGTYTTNTTANSKRNTNVKLAAQQLNGTIVQPGQELSFNDAVGERTEAKGYQSAAAYSNGEVVQEIGGGVCQVSTTLYNAVLQAGLQISMRRSHTFEPTYVTPGQDATVSWGGPDFRFVNTSKAAIGIRASYYNQTVTVSVYGIPVLEDGVTYSLESKKLGDLDPPAPTYEEDPTIPPDQEVTVSSGSRGSKWETRLVIKKNGEVISNEIDHTTSYKGHAPVIKRNTSGVYIPPEGETGESSLAGETADASSTGESAVSSSEPSAGLPPGGSADSGSGQPSPEPPGETAGEAVTSQAEEPHQTTEASIQGPASQSSGPEAGPAGTGSAESGPAGPASTGSGSTGPGSAGEGPGSSSEGGDIVVAPPPI